MDHIKQYDWYSSEPDVYFLNESDIDSSVTERILRNKFHDPLISSESEDETDKQPKIKINWDEILNRKKQERSHRVIVPGLHAVPPYPKLSALTSQQHVLCLKVLCAEQPHILPAEFLPRPTKQDRKTFEELKETYAKEQQEFIEWAKTMWTSSHCVRALRPKPPVEMVYEAEFKMAAHMMQSFPKNYALAAQIPLVTANAVCELVHEKDLINVNISTLPKINIPDMSEKVFIMKPYPVPEPCNKHPCRFQLPGESEPTILPLTEVQRELAQQAAECGAQFAAGEEALRCVLRLERPWLLPLSVCRVAGPEGPTTAVVLGRPVTRARAAAPLRTDIAFHTLLEHALAQPVQTSEKRKRTDSNNSANKRPNFSREEDSSDDESQLYIDTDATMNVKDEYLSPAHIVNDEEESTLNGDLSPSQAKSQEDFTLNGGLSPSPIVVNEEDFTLHEGLSSNQMVIDEEDNFDNRSAALDDPEDNIALEKLKNTCRRNSAKEEAPKKRNSAAAKETKIDFYNCTCNDAYDKPPQRSYKKWKLINWSTNDKYSILVHCPHRVRGPSGEVVLEPQAEYQLDLGAARPPPRAAAAQLLALTLRKNATVLNVRIDSPTGEIVTTETVTLDDLLKQNEGIGSDVTNRLHTTLDQLQGLLPGHYILQHDPSHGDNAILFAAQAAARDLTLEWARAAPRDADEAQALRAPPTLAPVLLPVHKFRKILPCAFTPYPNQLAKETKKPVTRQKTPPQAIKLGEAPGDRRTRGQWPKKKNKKKKNNNNT